jgi:hypothetical protein
MSREHYFCSGNNVNSEYLLKQQLCCRTLGEKAGKVREARGGEVGLKVARASLPLWAVQGQWLRF